MRATVIIPTFNHGRLLFPSVRSVLRQTVADFELFIMGDGVTPETRKVIEELLATDSRIRFFDHLKSPRRGELYRHAALQGAKGKAVCYLSDDDLWFPDHLETFCRALEKLDVTHSRPYWVTVDDRVFSSLVDWRVPEWRAWTLRAEFPPFGLSFCGHTLDFYRRLPFGWRTTPPDRWPDHYMWEQLISVDGVHAGCTYLHTVIGFPSPPRIKWTPERREEELLAWEKMMIEDPQTLRDRVEYSLSYGSYYDQMELQKWLKRKEMLPRSLQNLWGSLRKKK